MFDDKNGSRRAANLQIRIGMAVPCLPTVKTWADGTSLSFSFFWFDLSFEFFSFYSTFGGHLIVFFTLQPSLSLSSSLPDPYEYFPKTFIPPFIQFCVTFENKRNDFHDDQSRIPYQHWLDPEWFDNN